MSNDRTYLDEERRAIAYDTALALRWDSLFDFTVHRAAKEHKCAGSPVGDGIRHRCEKPINPGDMYVRVVWAPPWYQVRLDEEVEQVGQWIVSKYHPGCVPGGYTLED